MAIVHALGLLCAHALYWLRMHGENRQHSIRTGPAGTVIGTAGQQIHTTVFWAVTQVSMHLHPPPIIYFETWYGLRMHKSPAQYLDRACWNSHSHSRAAGAHCSFLGHHTGLESLPGPSAMSLHDFLWYWQAFSVPLRLTIWQEYSALAICCSFQSWHMLSYYMSQDDCDTCCFALADAQCS